MYHQLLYGKGVSSYPALIYFFGTPYLVCNVNIRTCGATGLVRIFLVESWSGSIFYFQFPGALKFKSLL